MNAEKRIAITLAAFALICGLSVPAHAQLGCGWVPAPESYIIQVSAGCTAVPNGSGGGVFTVPGPGIFRAEFRYGNLPTTTMNEFEGYVVYNSLGGNRVNCKQTFGPDPSTPWQMLAFDKTLLAPGSATPGAFFDVETKPIPQPGLYPYTVGTSARVNTFYDPFAHTVDVYINGTHIVQCTGHTGAIYNKIGAYVLGSGSGPATVTWTNVQFWAGGTNGCFTVTASVIGGGGTVSPATQSVAAGANATITITPDAGFELASLTDNTVVIDPPLAVAPAGGPTYTINNVQANHMIVATFAPIGPTFTITASVNGTGGTATPALQTVPAGGSATVTLISDPTTPLTSPWVLASLTDNGSLVTPLPTGSQYTMTNVQTNHAIVATFKPNQKHTQITIPGSAVTASASQTGNGPANVVDGSLATRWAAKGATQWLQFNLGAVTSVSSVKIAFYKGDTRTQTFDIESSVDGKTTFTPIAGETGLKSSGTTLTLQSFDLATPVSTQYIRIVFHNSKKGWNSVTEVEIWGGGSTGPFTVTPVNEFALGGTITPSTPQTVAAGGSVTFTFTPNPALGDSVGPVMVDGTPVTLTNGSYTFSNVQVDHTITAIFVTIDPSGPITITP
jgi:hypothetical protein